MKKMITDDVNLFGNTFYFEEIYKWLHDSIDNPKKELNNSACLLIIGSPGVGKTYGVETICQKIGITIKKIDSSTCHSTKEMDDLIVKMSSTNLEDVLLQQIRKKIIFIDEFEILINNDRNMPSLLYNLINATNNKALPYIPIIIACNTNVEKKLGDLKRYCKSIYLKKPSDTDVMLMLLAHTKRCNISISAEILLAISESVNGNMLHALNSLEYELLKKNRTTTTDETYIIDRMPDIDTLYNDPSIEIAHMLFEEDLWMNPLRFHENLPAEIDMRKGTKAQKGKIYSEILKCMTEWDTMINTSVHTYTNTDEIGNSIYTEHLCRAPCFLLKNLKKKKNGNDTSLADFTKALSQMSLHKKMEKQSYHDNFPWKHVGNYFYALKKIMKNKKNKKFSSVDTDNNT